MTMDHLREDEIMRRVAELKVHDVNRASAERLRAQCREALTRARWRERLRAFVAGPFYRRVLEPAAVAAVCAAYLSEVVRRALALYGY